MTETPIFTRVCSLSELPAEGVEAELEKSR